MRRAPPLAPRRVRCSASLLVQESEHQRGDLVVLLIPREMAGLEQMYLGGRHVTLVRLAAWADERGIVLAPDHEGRRLVLAQPGLPGRIGGHVRPVVVQKRRLDLALAWSRQVRELVRPGVRVVTLRMRT